MDNGQKNIAYTYQNGELNGPSKTFDKEGVLLEENIYENGEKL